MKFCRKYQCIYSRVCIVSRISFSVYLDVLKCSSPQAMQPTPLQPEQCGGQGTPSPLSPTPSPAGSVGSVGSQSSGYNSGDVAAGRMVGGSSSGVVGGSSMGQQPPAANMGPCVAVPLSVHSAMQKQNQHYSYLLSCHELWEQADLLVYKGKHKGNVVLSCQYKLKMLSL